MSPTPVASGGNLCRKCKRPRGRTAGEARRGRASDGLAGGAPSCAHRAAGARRGRPWDGAGQGARECCCLGVPAGFLLLLRCFPPPRIKKRRECRGAGGRGGGRRERCRQRGAAGWPRLGGIWGDGSAPWLRSPRRGGCRAPPAHCTAPAGPLRCLCGERGVGVGKDLAFSHCLGPAWEGWTPGLNPPPESSGTAWDAFVCAEPEKPKCCRPVERGKKKKRKA